MLTGYPSVDKTHLEGIPESKLHPKIETVSLFGAFEVINATSMDDGKTLIERCGKTLTKREFESAVLVAAAGLLGLDLSPGDSLVMYAPNLIESMVIAFAANAIGMKIAYANFYKPLDHAIETINSHEAKLLVAADLDEAETHIALDRANSLKLVLDVASVDPNGDHPGYLTYAALKNAATPSTLEWAKNIIMSQMKSEAEMIFLQTSGSTANVPKILPFTNRNVIAALTYMTNGTNQTTNDEILRKGLCLLPFNHPYGWMMIVANLIGGNHVELVPSEAFDEIGKWYQYQANFIYGTPQVLRELIAKTPAGADLSPLKAFFSAGLKTEEELFVEADAFFCAHGSIADVRNNYGMGETLCIGTTSDGVPHRAGTCGKVYPGLELYVVDDDLNEVKYDEPGEILVWSESMVTHYFGDDEATQKSFIPYRGKIFFRTGDLGSLARDNYLTLLGRKKRFYQPRGAFDKVNCETVETALDALDIVSSSAVVIYKLADGSESGAAFVVLKNGIPPSDATREHILALLAEHLREFELPTKIAFMHEFPLLAAGKIDYPSLTEIAKTLA